MKTIRRGSGKTKKCSCSMHPHVHIHVEGRIIDVSCGTWLICDKDTNFVTYEVVE